MTKNSRFLTYASGFTTVMFFGVICLTNLAQAGSTATVAATVTVQNISVSVANGAVSYGTLAANTSSSTNSGLGGVPQTQTATNNGNVAEDLNIKGQNSANWTLGSAADADQYVQKFCTATCSNAANYTALTTNYQALANAVAANGTQAFDLRITTPNPSTVFTQQSVDVVVQATLD